MMPLDACDSGFLTEETDVLAEPHPEGMASAKQRLVVALDKPEVADARVVVQQLGDLVDIYKVGLELVLSDGGLRFARQLQHEHGKRIFLDMKLLDIPNTVEKAVANVARLGFEFLTVHAHDRKTMDAAVRGRNLADSRSESKRLKLLGVTVLTSYDQQDLDEQGLREAALDLAVRRASLACEAGFDGVIASGHETRPIREATRSLKSKFIIKVPGIRPFGSEAGDQTRVMTPTEALKRGATYLVIGRPITDAKSPFEATERILREIAQAT